MGKIGTIGQFEILFLNPMGIFAVLMVVIGMVMLFAYSIIIVIDPHIILNTTTQYYPTFFVSVGFLGMLLSVFFMKIESKKFIDKIKSEATNIKKHIRIEDMHEMELESSEFGIDNVDIEILMAVRESGGFLPILRKDVNYSAILVSEKEFIKRLAKLYMMEYLHLPEKGMRIYLSSRGLDVLVLPRITFTAKIPEDIALMLGHAHELYRNNEFGAAIGKCYNLLERALKVHLIPSVDDYQRKWNEKHPKDREKWKGNKTQVGLNALFNFYKEHSRFDEKTLKFVKNSIDYIADIRSRYSHDKPSPKRKNDAIRVLNLTEIVLGLLFEDMKRRVSILAG